MPSFPGLGLVITQAVQRGTKTRPSRLALRWKWFKPWIWDMDPGYGDPEFLVSKTGPVRPSDCYWVAVAETQPAAKRRGSFGVVDPPDRGVNNPHLVF